MPPAIEILVILLLVTINGMFAMSEIAVVSARKSRLQQLAHEGDARAEEALELSNSPNRFLSTVQIGITLVGVLAGAFGGAAVASTLATRLAQVPGLARYSDVLALILVVVGITYLSLVVGELVPKRIALSHPERIAKRVARPMTIISIIASPVVKLLSLSTDFLLRILRIRPADQTVISEEEIQLLIAEGTAAGIFDEAEQRLVNRVLLLDDLRAREIMTPRRRIIWLDLDLPLERNLQTLVESTPSRLVVCRGNLDDVVGAVRVRDLLNSAVAGEPIDFASALLQPHIVPETMRALEILELFKASGIHIALVIDEYGVIQGLITLTDILEAIVGDVPSVEEATEPPVVQREDGSWLVDGMLPIWEFKALLQVEELPAETLDNYQTVGGFMVNQLGRVPVASDYFEWSGHRFEVVDMDGHRVDKVLVMEPDGRSPATSGEEA
jgi:putative hemolysin